MIAIAFPIKCKKCGELIENYHLNKNNGKIDFPCSKCGRITEMTEEEYRKYVLKNKF